jgi:hypothetical protein
MRQVMDLPEQRWQPVAFGRRRTPGERAMQRDVFRFQNRGQ